MGIDKTNWFKIIVREFGAAFGVLSLILLSIAHQPIDAGGRDIYRLADGSIPVICGLSYNPAGEGELSSGCDVCRISNGISPPITPCGVSQRFALSSGLDFIVAPAPAVFSNFSNVGLARAPPKIL